MAVKIANEYFVWCRVFVWGLYFLYYGAKEITSSVVQHSAIIKKHVHLLLVRLINCVLFYGGVALLPSQNSGSNQSIRKAQKLIWSFTEL